MRKHNAATILEVLYHTGPTQMTVLQKKSGLSRRTIELIVSELITTGWVSESSVPQLSTRTVGRPARSFTFRYDAAYIVTLQLEAGHLRATVANLAADVVNEIRHPIHTTASRAKRLALLEKCVTLLLGDIERKNVIAVTLSTPGIVRDDGTVDLPMTMPEWTGFSLSEAVGKLFHCPVHVENDAKLAALGEKWPHGNSAQNFAYIFADGDRLGVGLVLRGELHRGLNGTAGEVTWANQLGFTDLADTILADLDDQNANNNTDAHALVSAVHRGEASAQASVEHLAEVLAPGITAIAWLLAPEEIILGGTLGTIQKALIPALNDTLARNSRPVETKIRGAQHGDQSVLIGCLRLCIESFSERFFTSFDPETHGAPVERAGSGVS
ncbi:ROK family protein [Lysinibacter sp. HNR]|uniref:ROK family protein n=1 Tax=Lysinibacter sp. HNR TaxID=3031408 RepID=UPI002434E40E|nr:ROK family protein [Lysinibacter sp. HNR]WGD37226.1 ROK family protein [Lysinibacter sp. HNR]